VRSTANKNNTSSE